MSSAEKNLANRPEEKRATALMVQGTGSSVGKSVIAAALCRILAQDGVNVAPFKAQNMSNNSYVTADGGEMGRAQVVQAQAAGVEPHTDMNPVLLKPEADSRSQVVINGKPVGSFEAKHYWGDQSEVWSAVTAAYDRLAARYDVIVLEGAGSPAEVNLRDRDIVNMKMAAYANASVILVGDIDRGGVFASLLGTLELLLPGERKLVKALLINRFRGDRTLLDPLPEMIADRTGIPVIGVVPFIYDLQIKDEDGVTFGDYVPPSPGVPRGAAPRDQVRLARPEPNARPATNDVIEVAVIGLPRISNHDDLDPFRRAGCRIRVVTTPQELSGAHIVIIPGSKSTIADLRWMKSRNLDDAVVNAANRGVTIVGICGGYQLLGQQLDDPDATESGEPQSEPGLGLLPISTVFDTTKTTRRVNIEIPETTSGPLKGPAASGSGYEIHTGITTGTEKPLSTLSDDASFPRNAEGPHMPRPDNPAQSTWPDGASSDTLPIIGSYVHGLFDSPGILRRLLYTTADTHNLPRPQIQEFSMEAEYDRLAKTVREAIDMDLIRTLIE
ncbi:MAG: cobyric acid synthase [Chloroflexi bacterium]|nr:cobyric acid synthase [Chloroflexota bacterium]